MSQKIGKVPWSRHSLKCECCSEWAKAAAMIPEEEKQKVREFLESDEQFFTEQRRLRRCAT